MALPYRVHLLGFSDFERNALTSTFRLATHRTPAYEVVARAGDAHFLVVDGDQPEAVRSVLASGRVAEAVFIGAAPPEAATAWMLRPIDPLHVQRELDAMVSLVEPLPPAPAVRDGRDGPARRASDGPARAAGPASALLVDDSEIALRWLEVQLHPLGLQTVRAGSSGRAIELLSQRPFDIVFADVELGLSSSLDGLALCQHIKRHHHRGSGRGAPLVALVSAHDGEVDRARGSLAGCDAYFAKPVRTAALAELLALHKLTPAAAP